MHRELPNLCINSRQLNQVVLGRQISGSNLGCLNVICIKITDLIGMEKHRLKVAHKNQCVSLSHYQSLLTHQAHTYKRALSISAFAYAYTLRNLSSECCREYCSGSEMTSYFAFDKT